MEVMKRLCIGVDNSHFMLVEMQLRKVCLRHIIKGLKIEQFLFSSLLSFATPNAQGTVCHLT